MRMHVPLGLHSLHSSYYAVQQYYLATWKH